MSISPIEILATWLKKSQWSWQVTIWGRWTRPDLDGHSLTVPQGEETSPWPNTPGTSVATTSPFITRSKVWFRNQLAMRSVYQGPKVSNRHNPLISIHIMQWSSVTFLHIDESVLSEFIAGASNQKARSPKGECVCDPKWKLHRQPP
jgi:hypothetical protein